MVLPTVVQKIGPRLVRRSQAVVFRDGCNQLAAKNKGLGRAYSRAGELNGVGPNKRGEEVRSIENLDTTSTMPRIYVSCAFIDIGGDLQKISHDLS